MIFVGIGYFKYSLFRFQYLCNQDALAFASYVILASQHQVNFKGLLDLSYESKV